MRVVLDTNVLARALPGRGNAAEAVLLLLLESPHVLILSDFMLVELARVLRYERMWQIHGLSYDQLVAFVELLRQGAELVDVPAAAADAVVLPDPSDDPIVATAVLGRADVITTWDRHFRAPEVVEYLAIRGVRVLREADLLTELRDKEVR